MGVWYRTIAASASTALTLCFVIAGEVVAVPNAMDGPTLADPEEEVRLVEEESTPQGDVGQGSNSAANNWGVDEVGVENRAIAPENVSETAPENAPEVAASNPEPTDPAAPNHDLQSQASFDEFSVPGFDETTEGAEEDQAAEDEPTEATAEPVLKTDPATPPATAEPPDVTPEQRPAPEPPPVDRPASGSGPSDAPTEPLPPETLTLPAEVVEQTSDDGVTTADLLEDDSDLSPLETNPNPLHYPTLPEEVRVVLRQPITLEQALELARRNSRTLESARLNLEQAQEGLKVSLAARYPQLNLTATLLNTLAAGTRLNLLQANDATRRAGGNDIVEDPADRNADTTTYTLSLQLNYNIYSSGQRLNQVRAARAQVQEAEFAMEAAFEQVRFDVTNAYYILQQETEQLKIDEVSVGFRQQNVKDAEALEKAGLGTRFEVLQAEVELANDRQTVEQTQSRLTQARRELARQLSLPEVIDINAADPIQKVGDWNLNLEESILTAYRNRAELAQQLAQRDVAEALRRVERAQNGPQLDAIAQYDLFDVLEAEDNFGPVYGYSASLQLSWNLFDGGANRAQAAQQDSLRRSAENQFAIQREAIRFDVEQSYANLVANTASIRTALQAIEAAEEEVRLARLRFRAGVGTQTDRLNAETRFIRARGNVLLAIVGYNQAVSSLMRAVSNLPPGTVSPAADPVSLPELTVEEVLDRPPSSFRDTGDIFTPIPSAQPPAGDAPSEQ